MESAGSAPLFNDDAGHSPEIRALKASLAEAQGRVLDHPIYRRLATVEDLIAFTELHVYAVWDFMSLLKTLQREFTCVEVPWRPTASPAARRLINEITLVEETDTYGDGYLSHFELYLAAMEDLGADTSAVRRFVGLLDAGVEVPEALERAGVPAAAAAFVRSTWHVVTTAPVHAVAAAFALTREDLIPEMFERVVSAEAIEAGRLDRFVDYLRRHIQVDAEEHTPMAMRLLLDLCGGNPQRWAECVTVARSCFDARAALWSGVCAEIDRRDAASRPGGGHAVGDGRPTADPDTVAIRVELPGTTSAEDLEVTVTSGVLSVRDRVRGQGCDIALAGDLRASDVQAHFSGGVLTLRCPAAPATARVRRHAVAVHEALETPAATPQASPGSAPLAH